MNTDDHQTAIKRSVVADFSVIKPSSRLCANQLRTNQIGMTPFQFARFLGVSRKFLTTQLLPLPLDPTGRIDITKAIRFLKIAGYPVYRWIELRTEYERRAAGRRHA